MRHEKVKAMLCWPRTAGMLKMSTSGSVCCDFTDVPTTVSEGRDNLDIGIQVWILVVTITRCLTTGYNASTASSFPLWKMGEIGTSLHSSWAKWPNIYRSSWPHWGNCYSPPHFGHQETEAQKTSNTCWDKESGIEAERTWPRAQALHLIRLCPSCLLHNPASCWLCSSTTLLRRHHCLPAQCLILLL